MTSYGGSANVHFFSKAPREAIGSVGLITLPFFHLQRMRDRTGVCDNGMIGISTTWRVACLTPIQQPSRSRGRMSLSARRALYIERTGGEGDTATGAFAWFAQPWNGPSAHAYCAYPEPEPAAQKQEVEKRCRLAGAESQQSLGSRQNGEGRCSDTAPSMRLSGRTAGWRGRRRRMACCICPSHRKQWVSRC